MCSTSLMEAPGEDATRHFPASPACPTSPEPAMSDGPGARSPSSAREDDDDEISVGCPSPSPRVPFHPDVRVRDSERTDDEDDRDDGSLASYHYRSGSSSPTMENHRDHREQDDYFKPLKKLKMMQINKQRKLRRQSSPPMLVTPTPAPAPPSLPFDTETTSSSSSGVKSFSIMDILNHRPRPSHSPASPGLSPMSPACGPTGPVSPSPVAVNPLLMLHGPMLAHAAQRIVRPWDFGPMLDPALMMERLHAQQQSFRRQQQQQHAHHVQQQHLHLQQQQQQVHAALTRPQSADLSSSACSSGRSSTASDCCSPSPDVRRTDQRHPTRQARQGKDGASPLDALFQMTSKTFEGLNGEQAPEGSGGHLNLFNSRQQTKKKRKSRTAFTNHQIFELEKRFLYQKYLSPADRDEIAAGLGLSNAQVITWFQNRRAKLKRDMEELKKDVESAKVLTAHKSFLEKVHSLGVLKKKAPTHDKSPIPEK